MRGLINASNIKVGLVGRNGVDALVRDSSLDWGLVGSVALTDKPGTGRLQAGEPGSEKPGRDSSTVTTLRASCSTPFCRAPGSARPRWSGTPPLGARGLTRKWRISATSSRTRAAEGPPLAVEESRGQVNPYDRVAPVQTAHLDYCARCHRRARCLHLWTPSAKVRECWFPRGLGVCGGQGLVSRAAV